MSVLITGGAGFVGSWTTRRLLADTDVVVFDVAPSDNALGVVLGEDDRARVCVVEGRTTDRALLRRACVENGVTDIVHLASPLTQDCIADPSVLVQGMAQAFVDLLEVARELDLRRIVWASSASVYGPAERYSGAVDEDSPRWPTTLYGSGKVLCEDLAAHYAAGAGVDVIGLRFPVVFGPGSTRGGSSWIGRLCEHAARGMPAEVPWLGHTVNIVYVEDIARLVEQALRAPPTRTRSFTVSGETVAVDDIVAFVRELAPGAVVHGIAGRLELPWTYDASRLRLEVGFSPSVDVHTGLRRIFDAALDA